MKIITCILALSVAGNIGFSIAYVRKHDIQIQSKDLFDKKSSIYNTRDQSGPADTTVLPSAPSNSAPDVQRWKLMVDKLQQAGLTLSQARSCIRALLNEDIDASRQQSLADQPFWRRRTPPATMGKIRELENAATATMISLFGEENAITGDPIARKRAYGNLPTEKISRIEQIRRDYIDMLSSVQQNTELSIEDRTAQLKFLYHQRDQDINTALTKEEYREYAVRSSAEADQLARLLSNIEISEQQYYKLFDLQHDYLTTKAGEGDLKKLNTARENYLSGVKEQLGDDRFYKYMAGADPTYAAILEVTGRFGLPPSVAFEVANIQYQTAAGELRANKSIPKIEAALGPAYNAYQSTRAGSWTKRIESQKRNE